MTYLMAKQAKDSESDTPISTLNLRMFLKPGEDP